MLKSIKDILMERGPMLSGELAQLYEEANAVSNVAARKAVSRAHDEIFKSRDIPFKNKQKFVYLEAQFRTPYYRKAMLLAVKDSYKLGYEIIKALVLHAGIASREHLAAYTASPIKNVSGHQRFDSVLERLKTAHIVEELDERYIQLADGYAETPVSLKRAKAIEIAETVTLTDFCDLLRNTNVISFEKGKIWNDFGQFLWCLSAPSYVHGVAAWDKKERRLKPGFMLADIVLQYNASVEDVSFFVEKIKIVRSYRAISNFVPILLVYGLEHQALQYLKEYNVVVALIGNIFGDKYKQMLGELIEVITNATEVALNEPERLNKFLDELLKFDGRHNNVAGALFELMVANFYTTIGQQYLEINKRIAAHETLSGRPRDIDVLVERNGMIIAIECKGTKSQIEEEYVHKWLTERVPDIQCFLSKIYPTKRVEHQIWSVGGFTETATAELALAEERTRRYNIKHYNRKEMLDYAAEMDDKVFIHHINEHFK